MAAKQQTGSRGKRSGIGRRLVLAMVSLVPLLGAELLLRLGGRPRGTYDGYFRLLAVEESRGAEEFRGLYAPGAREEVELPGAHRAVVQANSLGLRGREISRIPEAGVFRIACVGDSVTDGMYVSDPHPFAAQMDRIYREAGRPVEVVNVARAGATIHKEQVLLESVALRLRPSLVLLTFVTNDLSELRFEKMEHRVQGPDALTPAAGFDLARWVCTRTALGEWGLETWLDFRASPERRRAVDESRAAHLDSAAVETHGLPGGSDFQRHVGDFRRRFRQVDGLALEEPFSAEAERLYAEWRRGFERFVATGRVAGTAVALAFFPAYSQVCGDTPGAEIRGRLAGLCEDLQVAFLDLTPAFRAQRDEVLHFAPIDFHPNRRGHELMARALVQMLDEEGLVPK